MACMFYKGLSTPPSKRDAVFICLVFTVQMCACVYLCAFVLCVFLRPWKGCVAVHMHLLRSTDMWFNAALFVTAEFKRVQV